MYKRNIETEFLSWIERDEILIITGSRQVGKTSFMKDMQSKISQKSVVYNLEDFELLQLFNISPKNLVQLLQENFSMDEKVYVFIDEIQYLDDPSNFLKYIYDEHKDTIKLIVSGSSAFYIDQKFNDSLAGRKKIFHLKPLNFPEFLIFNNEDILSKKLKDFSSLTSLTQQKILSYFSEFLTFGGYPKVVLEKEASIKKELLGEIVNSYLKKDILESNVELPEKFFLLYKILAGQTGQLLNAHELSTTLGLSITAVRKYLSILKKTFHFYELSPYYTNIRKELTKMPKFYIQDLGIKNYFEKNFNPIENRVDIGAIFESYVFQELQTRYSMDSLHFWRTQDKKEIDFIIEAENISQAYEVKYTAQKVSFQVFLKSYPQFQTQVLHRENMFEILFGEDSGDTENGRIGLKRLEK